MIEEKRVKDEKERIKDWERKFDKEQERKEAELVKKFNDRLVNEKEEELKKKFDNKLIVKKIENEETIESKKEEVKSEKY